MDSGMPLGQAIAQTIGSGAELTSRRRIPPALRFGVGRVSKTQWLDTMCIGFPWGSPLVAIGTSGCSGFKFADLQPRTPDQTNAAGGCRALDDIYSEQAACIR